MVVSSQAYTLVSENLGAEHYSASAVDPTQSWQVPANAFDGSFDWPVWLAGAGAPQWIEVNLGQAQKLAKVSLCLEQYPAGNTTQEIYFSDSPIGNDRTGATLVHTFGGSSNSGDIREYVLPSPILARYVQVYCTQWQNNVALREVQLFVPEQATVGVDGEVSDGEYDAIRYDLYGATNESGYWVSETQVDSGKTSIADVYRWGCKVEDDVFYAFVELKDRNIKTLDGGSLNSPCSRFGFFIDTDNNAATGYPHTDFPNDSGFDVDLEVGNDNGYLGQAGTINFWFGASNFGTYTPASNAQVYYYGNVLEISCPVADIFTKTGVSAANGRFWRIAPRVEGCLDGSGATNWEADVADAAVIDVTNKSPKVIPTVDGVVSEEEWAGGMFCDMTVAGTYCENDGTTNGGTSDISRWGAKIINGVYYGFVEIDPSSAYGLAAYANDVSRRINVSQFLDVDGNMTNGGNVKAIGFPANMDTYFDLGFENELTSGSTARTMTLFLGNLTAYNLAAISQSWNGYACEWSCPMSVIQSAATVQGMSVAQTLRVAARVNGTLVSEGSWSRDVSTPAMVKSITLLSGDANLDNAVDVGDLGILAANYGGSGKTWAQGDFNNDGTVDVGDLGILAANYGTNASGANFDTDYAKVFGTVAASEDSADTEDETESTICSSLGLSLIAGLTLMGLMLVKLDE
jgi:hypothetical protein